MLVQLGLLDAGTLPVAGIETARKALNPSLPSNALIDRADRGMQPEKDGNEPLAPSVG